MTGERWTTVNLKVGNIAKMTGLALTVEHDSTGWMLAEGSDTGGISVAKFGTRRRTYGPFIEWLDAIILGLVLGEQKWKPLEDGMTYEPGKVPYKTPTDTGGTT